MSVQEIGSVVEFDQIMEALTPGQLLVVDFHAVWCGPCKFIAPVIQRMAAQYTDVVFVKVDVDKVKDLARRYQVTAMPTFALIKDGKQVDSLRGADPKRLIALVAQHAGGGKTGAEVNISDLAPKGLPPLVRVGAFLFCVFVVWKWF